MSTSKDFKKILKKIQDEHRKQFVALQQAQMAQLEHLFAAFAGNAATSSAAAAANAPPSAAVPSSSSTDFRSQGSSSDTELSSSSSSSSSTTSSSSSTEDSHEARKKRKAKAKAKAKAAKAAAASAAASAAVAGVGGSGAAAAATATPAAAATTTTTAGASTSTMSAGGDATSTSAANPASASRTHRTSSSGAVASGSAPASSTAPAIVVTPPTSKATEATAATAAADDGGRARSDSLSSSSSGAERAQEQQLRDLDVAEPKSFAIDTPQLREQYRSLCAVVAKALKAGGTDVRSLTVDVDDCGDMRASERVIDIAMEDALKRNAASLAPAASLYVCDIGVIVRRWLEWQRFLPRVKTFYAVKSNPSKELVGALAALGASFDCASRAEIQLALDHKVAPTDIIYANPCKERAQIEFAKAHGVNKYTLDNRDELLKLFSLHPEAQLVVRLLVDDTLSVMPFGTKFGANLQEAEALIDECRTLGANLVGFAFHVGSGCQSPLAFDSALRTARKAFDAAAAKGFNCSLLDIGGGYPGGSPDDSLSFSAIANVVAPLLDELFPRDQVTVIAEPGRYFCTAPFALSVTVNATRIRYRTPKQLARQNTVSSTSSRNDASERSELRSATATCNADDSTDLSREDQVAKGLLIKEVLYYLSDGVYGSFNNIVFDHAHAHPLLAPSLAKEKGKEPTEKSTLFGPTCDSIDVVARDVMLPKLRQGDRLYFRYMGAYTIAAASAFNGFAVPSVHFYTVTSTKK